MKMSVELFMGTFYVSGLIMIVMSRSHLIMILLSLEYLMLMIYVIMFLYFMMCKMELFYLMLYLIFSVCEGVLGLSIMVSMIRTHGNDYFQSNVVLC